MSDDLISRSELIKILRVQGNSWNNYIENTIREMQTAYDVDKVIKQLEERLNGTNIQLEIAKDFENKESISVKKDILFFTERKRLYEEVLEIVKSGGVADE